MICADERSKSSYKNTNIYILHTQAKDASVNMMISELVRIINNLNVIKINRHAFRGGEGHVFSHPTGGRITLQK